MFMKYNPTDGAPISYHAEQPTSGTWTVIPASAMQDPPLCYWDQATKQWADGDGGYRWNEATQQFDYAFGNLQLEYFNWINRARATAIASAFPDAATVLYTERLGIEARAYAGDASPTLTDYPMINQLKTVNGLTEMEAVNEAKSQWLFYHAAIGAVWARWRKAQTDIEAATTLGELASAIAIDWDAVITNATGDLTDWPESYLRVAAAAKGVHAKEVILSTGAYISQAVNGLALSTAASAADRFYAFPFIPAQTITINELAVEVTTLTEGSAHLGIYADSAGSPGAKIIGSTTAVDTGTTGAKAVAISNTTLTAGTIYWLVVWTSSAATFRSVAQGALAVIGLTSTLNAQYTSRLATSTFGALPTNAPATTLTVGEVPWLRMKIA